VGIADEVQIVKRGHLLPGAAVILGDVEDFAGGDGLVQRVAGPDEAQEAAIGRAGGAELAHGVVVPKRLARDHPPGAHVIVGPEDDGFHEVLGLVVPGGEPHAVPLLRGALGQRLFGARHLLAGEVPLAILAGEEGYPRGVARALRGAVDLARLEGDGADGRLGGHDLLDLLLDVTISRFC